MEMKRCNQGNECIHPDGANLPISEFYTYPNGAIYGHCKACQKERVKKTNKHLPYDEITIRGGELLAIQKLREVGIFADAGKVNRRAKWKDVLAWGCVIIEVKTANFINEAYHFTANGKKKGKESERSHFVMLICLGDPVTYHLFPSDHPVFYHIDGRPKSKVKYKPDSMWRHSNNIVLDNELMAQYQDRFDLIEEKRKQISARLRHEDYQSGEQPTEVKPRARILQLKLFNSAES